MPQIKPFVKSLLRKTTETLKKIKKRPRFPDNSSCYRNAGMVDSPRISVSVGTLGFIPPSLGEAPSHPTAWSMILKITDKQESDWTENKYVANRDYIKPHHPRAADNSLHHESLLHANNIS